MKEIFFCYGFRKKYNIYVPLKFGKSD